MARKLAYNAEKKFTFQRESIYSSTVTGTRMCANCKRSPKMLFRYWEEPNIGGVDAPPSNTLPFCGIKCYRKYYGYTKVKPDEPMFNMIEANKKSGKWVCDAADHNSSNGCSNPNCFKYKKRKN